MLATMHICKAAVVDNSVAGSGACSYHLALGYVATNSARADLPVAASEPCVHTDAVASSLHRH